MSSPEAFAQQCEEAARGLRRAPADLRRALSKRVGTEVAYPLAQRVKGAAAQTGPWSRVLAGGTKARAGAQPVIVVGGASPKLKGGGGPRSVLYGVEFGSGKRLTAVPKSPKHRGYRRYSTRQFARHQRPFIFPTIQANWPKTMDAYAGIVLDVIGEAVD